MANLYTFRKNDKFGEIDFSKLKSGITKEELGIQEGSILDSIWKSIDTNQSGNSKDKLDRQEIQTFIEKIKTLCGKDTNLTTGEAKNYVYGKNEDGKELELGKKNRTELLTFLSKLSELTKGITNVETETATNIETITYDDGDTEKVEPDGSKTIISKDGKTITEKDANGNITKETLKTDDKETVTEFEANSTNPKKQTITSNGIKSVIWYAKGKPIKKTTTNPETGIIQEFEYIDGNEVLKKTTNSKNGEITTHNGNNSTTTMTTDDGTTVIERNGDSVTRKKTTTQTEQGEQISDITYDGENSTENVSINGKPSSQKMVIDGSTYEVNYDEDGNTLGVIVQNGESIKAIADKFGVSPAALVKANAKLLKGGKRYFNAGDEIVIPRIMQADEYTTAQAGRKDAEGVNADYKAAEARRKAEAARREAEGQARIARQDAAWGVKNRKNYGKPVTCYLTRKGKRTAVNGIYIGQSAKYEGRWVVKVNGKIYTMSEYDNTLLKEEYLNDPEAFKARAKSAKEYNKTINTRKNAEGLAKQFYQIADNNSGMTSLNKMLKLLASVNEKNITAFLDAYDKEKHGDSSIVDTVISENICLTPRHREILENIFSKLMKAAQNAGVSNSDLRKASLDFKAALDKEFSTHTRATDRAVIERPIDFLRGCIVAKQTGNVEQLSDEAAMKKFNSSNAAEANNAQKTYNNAKGEGWSWTARTGDTVLGWFGCKTIEEMEAKLGKSAADVKKLAKAKSFAEFKAIYKQIFGIEFDKNKIAAREAALGNYQQAAACEQTLKLINQILKKSTSTDYKTLRAEIKSKFQFDDTTIDSIINEYAKSSGKNTKSDTDKRILLLKFLQNTKAEASNTYRSLTKGKTVEQMGKDVELLHRSAFGTSDIANEVAKFTENLATTEMITEGAFEIAGTIALQFVPGLGQMAAARLAISAAKWGTKAVKIANAAQKAQKAFVVVQKASTATKKGKFISAVANTGVATAAVDLSNGDDVKSTLRKTLMNMSFAGAGVTSSILAPKLMQALNVNKALATEIAEEILNAAGAYGITTISGSEYGSEDAFIDFVTGMVMARVSHIKTGKHTEVSGNRSKGGANVEGTEARTSTPKTQKQKENVVNNENPHITEGQETPVLDRISKNSAENSVGKLNNDNYAELQREVAHKLENATTEAELDALALEIKKLQVRDQKRPLLQQIEAKKAELQGNSIQPEAPHVDEPEFIRVDGEVEVEVVDANPHIDEPKLSLNDPVKAAGLRGKLGQNLFAVYQAVERGIDTLKDISGYNKLKTVIANKFKDSPAEFSELITRLNNKAKKLGLKVVETTVDRTARMGKSLAKYYDKIEATISLMKDLKRFNKLLDRITTKFANFKDDMKALLDKLYAKAKSLNLSIKESYNDVCSRVGIKASGVKSLDKYVRSKHGIDMSKTHEDWMQSRKDLFDGVTPHYKTCWAQYTPKDRHHGAWKMHLYSVSESDWREMCDVIIPYLKDHDIDWKTFNDQSGVHDINGSRQRGKAFTVYPKNNEDMAQVAKDLDYIIRKNKLETNGSHITGDNQMGSTGRLFYRYEFNSGAYKDEILDLSPGSADWNRYIQYDKYGRQTGGYYDANRGEGRYLAADMTEADDIWRNFDPSDPNAMPSASSSAQNRGTLTVKLQKGEQIEIHCSAKLNLANTIEIDLNNPRIKTRIDNLPEGGRLTIGREGDIRINDPSNTVSRVHVIIEKRKGEIHIIDNSTNGTIVST